jgi:ADP-heptose:LPS heptosyltransferase
MICTTPLWRILKRQAPHLEIGVVASVRNADVVRADTDLAHVHIINPYDKQQTAKTLKDVRSHNYDAVVICKLDRLVEAAVMARKCTQTGWTVGISINPKVRHDLLFSYSTYMPHAISSRHMTDQLLFILEQSFVLKNTPQDERRPSLAIDPVQLDITKAQVASILKDHNTERFTVVNTQARNEFLEWGYEQSIAFSEQLTRLHPDMSVLLTSSPEREEALLKALSQRPGARRMAYFPTPDLHQLFSLIRLSSLVVSPDTSIIHIASAERKPTIGLYPRPTNWQPYHVPAYAFYPQQDQPVATIALDRVLAAVQDLLDEGSSTVAECKLHHIAA